MAAPLHAPSRLQVAYLATSLAVATAFGVIAWAWGNLSWKLTGSPETARDVAIAVFGVVALLCYSGVRRRPTRILRFLAVALPIVLPTCGGCLTSVSDFNPGGGVNFALENNTPANQSVELLALLFGGMLVGLSALWPLRRAARADTPEQAPGLVLGSGLWLLASLGVIAVLCRHASLHVDRWLLPWVFLGIGLALLGVVMRRLRWWRRFALLGVGVSVGTAWLAILSSRTPLARCERESGGLIMNWHTSAVTGYRAPGVAMQRMVCKTTFQYSDEETRFVFGTTPDGRTIVGGALFARVAGSPLARAQAARDLLLANDCDELALPGDAEVRAAPFEARVRAPYEQDGKLVFFGLHHESTYGRGTSVGTMIVPTRYEVDLRTFATTRERLR